MAGDSLKDMGRAGCGLAGGNRRALSGGRQERVLRLFPLPECIGRKGGKIEQNGTPGTTVGNWGGWRQVCLHTHAN